MRNNTLVGAATMWIVTIYNYNLAGISVKLTTLFAKVFLLNVSGV